MVIGKHLSALRLSGTTRTDTSCIRPNVSTHVLATGDDSTTTEEKSAVTAWSVIKKGEFVV